MLKLCTKMSMLDGALILKQGGVVHGSGLIPKCFPSHASRPQACRSSTLSGSMASVAFN